MIKHYVYVIIHKKTGKLLSEAYDDKLSAEKERCDVWHPLPYEWEGKSYPASQTEVLELRVRK